MPKITYKKRFCFKGNKIEHKNMVVKTLRPYFVPGIKYRNIIWTWFNHDKYNEPNFDISTSSRFIDDRAFIYAQDYPFVEKSFGDNGLIKLGAFFNKDEIYLIDYEEDNSSEPFGLLFYKISSPIKSLDKYRTKLIKRINDMLAGNVCYISVDSRYSFEEYMEPKRAMVRIDDVEKYFDRLYRSDGISVSKENICKMKKCNYFELNIGTSGTEYIHRAII